MLKTFRRHRRRPLGFFLAFFSLALRLSTGAPLTFSHVTQAGQDTQENVEREKNGRLVKHPFGEALKKGSTHSKKYPDADAPHRVRGARPKKGCAHEQPLEPQQREQNK